MTKFVFTYHAPADAPELSPEQNQAVMQEWMSWAGEVGDRMVDFGTPLAGSVRVTPSGTGGSDRQVTGYTIIEADDMESALALARNRPHLNMAGGCEIEVLEALPVPGM
jgi:hypothetical protein